MTAVTLGSCTRVVGRFGPPCPSRAPWFGLFVSRPGADGCCSCSRSVPGGCALGRTPEVNILQSVRLRSVSVPSFGIRISGGGEKRREGQEAGAGRKVASGRDAVRTQRCRRAAPTLAGVCGKSVRSLCSAEPSPERVTGRLCPLVLSGEPGDKTRSCRSLRCSNVIRFWGKNDSPRTRMPSELHLASRSSVKAGEPSPLGQWPVSGERSVFELF